MGELNEAQKMFCREYIANNYSSATAAYQKAYPTAKPNSAHSNAHRLLKNPKVLQYLKELQHDRVEELNITADRIAEELSKMAFANYGEYDNANSKLKALELLSKQLGLYTQKIDADVNSKNEITITIGNDESEQSSN